jgi:hypothetical protein
MDNTFDQKCCESEQGKCYALINVNPEGGGGRARGGDLTFLQKKMSNATPSGENSWAKLPTPGMKLLYS